MKEIRVADAIAVLPAYISIPEKDMCDVWLGRTAFIQLSRNDDAHDDAGHATCALGLRVGRPCVMGATLRFKSPGADQIFVVRQFNAATQSWEASWPD